MGIFNFWKSKPLPAPEEPKQLPPPKFACGLCAQNKYQTDKIEDIFYHWVDKHTTEVVEGKKREAEGGPFRSMKRKRNAVFIVRRPYLYEGQCANFGTSVEEVVANYFAYVITILKMNNPHMRFQLLPAAFVGGRYLKTLLVVADWDEE